MKNLFWLFLMALFLLSACQKEHAADPGPIIELRAQCDSLNVSFAIDIEPIFSTNCALPDCHDNITAQHGITYQTYEEISDRVLHDKVLCAINHGEGCEHMPKDADKLHDTLIRKIECWHLDGAPNN